MNICTTNCNIIFELMYYINDESVNKIELNWKPTRQIDEYRSCADWGIILKSIFPLTTAGVPESIPSNIQVLIMIIQPIIIIVLI